MKLLNKFFSWLTVIALFTLLMATNTVSLAETSNNSYAKLLTTYANVAHDVYDRTLRDALALQQSIQVFTTKPDKDNLDKAKKSWLSARESYGQTEIFRLANGPIDAEEGWVAKAYGSLEGQLNAWPLDENMIDYTIDENGNRTSGNIIDTIGKFTPGGEDAKSVDVTNITVKALTELNENGGDANVATGYHAIEFLFWGQDQDYNNFSADQITQGALVAGQRPLEDFTTEKFASRRLEYLNAVTDKLVIDLKEVASGWNKNASIDCDKDATGCYRAAFLGTLNGRDVTKNLTHEKALRETLSAMGVFVKSELANERIAVAVLTPSEEDEHSCFSDNTHRDISMNFQGFVNVLKGQFNGKSYGVNIYDQLSPDTRTNIDKLITKIDAKISSINELAANKWHFDYQILPGNNAKEIKSLKNDLRKLGDEMVNVAKDLYISLHTSDVTDAGETRI